jgi:hypothetical protein
MFHFFGLTPTKNTENLDKKQPLLPVAGWLLPFTSYLIASK